MENKFKQYIAHIAEIADKYNLNEDTKRFLSEVGEDLYDFEEEEIGEFFVDIASNI